MAINREMQGALGEDNSVFSRQCAQALLLVKCQLCDPEFGQDRKPSVCLSLCSSWLAACRNDYFGFSFNGDLVPCTTLSSSKILVCSRLDELLIEQRKDKEDKFEPDRVLCQLAGLKVHADEDEAVSCYSGSIASISPSSCEGAKMIVQPARTDKSLEGGEGVLTPIAITITCILLVMAYRSGLLSYFMGQGLRGVRHRSLAGGLTEEEKRAIALAVEKRQQEVENNRG